MARTDSSPYSSRLATISALALERWRMVLACCAGLAVAICIAWLKIPRLEDPRVETNEVSVELPYPGASAEAVEAQVLRVVDPDLRELDGVVKIESRAWQNRAVLLITFEDGASMDSMVERVRGRLEGQRAKLPSEVEQPQVTRVTTASMPAMVVAVAGNRSDEVLADTANRVRDAIATVSGVAGTTLRGARERAVRVELDGTRLAQFGLDAESVAKSLRASNARAADGIVRVGDLTMLLEVDSALRDAQEIRQLPVTVTSDAAGVARTVSLGEVANVRDSERKMRERFLSNGQPAIGIEVRFTGGANAIETGKRVRATLRGLEPTVPAAVQLRVVHDQPEWIADTLAAFFESLAEGALLVFGVIAFGLGIRAAVIVAGVIPLAIGGAVLGLFITGMSLDRISIAGLIVALGLLVDDAVVVVESVALMRHKGLDGVRASVLGTARVFHANNATTVVACVSFMPLFFMGGTIGTYVRGLPVAVLFALVTSLVVAQLFTPWLSLGLREDGLHRAAVTDPMDDRGATAQAEPLAWLRASKRAYAAAIEQVLRRPREVVAAFAILLVAAILALPHVGIDFFPKSDKAVLFVRIDADAGSTLDATAEKLATAIATIRSDSDVMDTSAVLGGPYPDIFPGYLGPRAATNVADVLVRVKSARAVPALAVRLRSALATIPGARATVAELYEGPPVTHPIVVHLTGETYETLRAYAGEVREQLGKIPGTVNIRDTLEDSVWTARVEVDRMKVARVGATPIAVAAALRAVRGEDRITSFYAGTDPVDVVIDSPARADAIDDLRRTPVATKSGVMVPLAAVSTIRIGLGPAELRHHDARRVVDVTADVDGALLPSAVLARLEPRLRTMHWAAGYSFSEGGASDETASSFNYLALAAIASLVVIAVLLLAMFDSWLLVGAIVVAVPFAMIGAVAGLLVAGLPFEFMSFLGLIALIGVFVNHKIYFVDRMRELMARGYDLHAAIKQAGTDRVRPVVLTAATAILGLIPLTVRGGPIWAAFGWVSIFGLAASIPLSLLLLPALVVCGYRIANTARIRGPGFDYCPVRPASLARDARSDTEERSREIA